MRAQLFPHHGAPQKPSMSTIDTQYAVTTKELPHSMIELSVTVPAPLFDAARDHAITHIGENLELPGFRKGKAPAAIVAQKVGEAAILEEMAEHVISKTYAAIMVDKKIDALGRPEVRITKIAMGNPLEFTLTTAIMPAVVLPDVFAIAKKVNGKKEAVTITDEDVEKTITQVKTIAAKRKAEEEKVEFTPDTPLPDLTDDFIKTLGDYSSVQDFIEKARAEITKEKERTNNEKHRVAIIEAILEKTTIELPEIIVTQELERMAEEYAHDIERMGMKFEEYMTLIKKSKDDLLKEWRPDAEKRAKVQLLVAEIANKENIEPTTEDLEKEINKLHILYPNTPIERIRGYVGMILTNELVFKKLEAA